jgi:hypothetical protein
MATDSSASRIATESVRAEPSNEPLAVGGISLSESGGHEALAIPAALHVQHLQIAAFLHPRKGRGFCSVRYALPHTAVATSTMRRSFAS